MCAAISAGPKNETVSTRSKLPRGAASYQGWRLAIYDFWVLNIVSTYAWRCPTRTRLLPLFHNNIRKSHLDIGVGSGYYLEHADIPAGTLLVLCDLSPTALEAATARVPGHVELGGPLLADVLQPLPIADRFDSASMYFLLHCLPGPVQRKTVVFDHIRQRLNPDGVLTGATVLGPRKGGVTDNLFARVIRRLCVWDGIMDNNSDDRDTLVAALHKNFEFVEAEVVGTVLIWKAERPRQD